MDPFSIVVGTLTLVQVCLKSSDLLYDAINSIRTDHQEVKHLLNEIKSLVEVLKALERNVKEDTDTYGSLDFVLEQCTHTCDNLNKAVAKAFGDSKQQFEGIKVWIRLKRHENDIEGFKKLIDSYKATLTIAVVDANLRTSRVTKGLLEEYTALCKAAAANLEERIEELGVKLELLHLERSSPSMDSICLTEEREALNQKNSLQQCLSICLRLIDHIQTIRPTVHLIGEDVSQTTMRDTNMNVPRITNNALDICTQSLSNTAQQIRDIADEGQAKVGMDEAELIQQLGGVQRCLEILKKSERDRVNIFEKIEQSEDSRVAMVSTIGDLIRGTEITIGARAISVMGQMSDESLQKGLENFTLSLQSRPSNPATEKATFAFEQKHGSGRTMNG
ncbi:hypothetical protein BKA66DRAFT_551508 [Pyrenochaeta sp. MPI-SDFR-AT-0127]|nr:hypothetical protein BKA66DRAFT_551508 [Pyrenochaeta sp. MPI-SDFR-AT-0127]